VEGLLRRGRAEDPRLSWKALSPAEIADARARIVASPPRPYDPIESSPPPVGATLAARIELLRKSGFHRLGGAIDITAPDFDSGSRPFHFLLHAWDPVALFLHAILAGGGEPVLEPTLAYAAAWLARFQGPALSAGVAAVMETAQNGDDDTWEGMAVGLRAFRLAGLVEAVARAGNIDDKQFGSLLNALKFHLQVLGQKGSFLDHSNHGIYQALGLLSAANRFPWFADGERLADLARARLGRLLARHFDYEGVHLEHSPSYHLNLLGSLIGARNAGLLEGSEIDAVVDKAEAALSWMITPAGRLAPFGDSAPVDMRQGLSGAARYRDPALRFLTSGGEIGDLPPPGVRLFRKAGYAFARVYHPQDGEWPDQASYLAQAGAFHSRVHKHADHLTFVWSEGPVDILVEPGRYGYLGRTAVGDALHGGGHWYSDPKRVYVESTRAHNCVEVGEQNHDRTALAPFGAGLRQAERAGPLVLFRSEAMLAEGLRQARLLVLLPGRFLLVIDDLSGQGAAEARQWFQLDPAWKARRNGAGYLATAGGRALRVSDLTGTATVEPVRRGQTEPLQGWVSPRDGDLTPASSLCLRGGPGGGFVTLFSLSAAEVSRPSLEALGEPGRRIAWTQGAVRHAVDLVGEAPGRIRPSLVREPD
jgi:hypothetical protein